MNQEHKEIQTDNGTVHYWISKSAVKEAPCLLFTHGLTADHTMFEKQVEYFEKSCTVITWDVPLHGLSRPYSNFSYENTAVALKTILNREGIEQAILVGMSMGGYPCQEFASRYPQSVEKLVMLDTTPFGLEYYSKSDLWWLKRVAPLAKLYPDRVLRENMAKSVSNTEYSYHKMLAMLKPFTKDEIIEQMDIAYGNFARENKDMSFQCPVLLLLGDSDKTGKVRQYNQDWARRTGYPLHIIKNAAHFSNGDNPSQVNLEIEKFIEESCT
ncbi:alpha/beta hydrolase [Eubacteriaceae bacterium ES3]|nr:alpha/beta hydrolase [Eubacteriaceae bacterium ES3]